MARLFGTLLKSGSQRYFYALDSVPGIVTPGVATLAIVGQAPSAAQNIEVFRTPATAVLTLNGLSLASPSDLQPAQAALSIAGLAPTLVTTLTISPALPEPIYTDPPDNSPTLITIMEVSPTPAALTLLTLEQNVTQGGNIGFVSPTTAQLSLGNPQFSLLLVEPPGVGALTIVGLAPTVLHSLTIEPDVGLVTLSGLAPTLARPFQWIDDDPAPSRTWITDAAA